MRWFKFITGSSPEVVLTAEQVGKAVVEAIINGIKNVDRVNWHRYELDLKFDAKFEDITDESSVLMSNFTISGGEKDKWKKEDTPEPASKKFLEELKKM